MKKNPQSIKECRDTQISDFNSYYHTVNIAVGMKNIFSEEEPCVFKVSEPSMKTDSNTVTPDMIFQCDNDTKGIVCEIKTSLPRSDELLLKDIKEQLEKYSKIEKGWKTESQKINEHSILLCVHRTDSKRLQRLLLKWKEENSININKKICISEWIPTNEFKPGSADLVLLSHRDGTTNCKYFDSKLEEDIKINLDDIATDYEERKFVKSIPPNLYIMTMLYQDIFPSFIDDQEEFKISIDDLMKTLIDYYTSWSGLAGEQSQIRRNWIVKAMEKFCEIKLAERIPGEERRYKIKWSKKIPKDTKKYLLDKLCGKEPIIIDDSKQTKLEFTNF